MDALFRHAIITPPFFNVSQDTKLKTTIIYVL